MSAKLDATAPQGEPPADADGEGPSRCAALIGALVGAVFFAATLLWLIPGYVPRPLFMPGFAPGPDAWPRVISSAGLVLCLLQAGQLAFAKGLNCRAPQRETTLSVAAALTSFVVFLLALPYLGFIGSTALLTFVMIGLTGGWRHKIGVVLVSIVLPVALWAFFSNFLGTRFPIGSLWRSLGF